MPRKKTKKDEGVNKVGVGIGLTAAAVAAAGAYFLYGSKSAQKNRDTVKSWALKAKAEVLEQLESAKSMTREDYDQLIATVAGTYATAKGVTKKDLKAFTTEMTEHWQSLEKLAKPKKKPVAKKSAGTKIKKTSTKTKSATKKTAKPKKKEE